jgi:AraC-like DNA-binding protein
MLDNGPPPAGSYGISPLVVQQCLKLGRSHGVSTDRMLEVTGLRREDVENANGWLPFSTIERLLHGALVEGLANDPLIGLRAAPQINLASLGVLGFVVQACSTLQDVIEMIRRYERLLSDVGSTSLVHEPGTALWRWRFLGGDPLVARHATECVVGCWAGLLRLVKQRKPRPLLAVRFSHAAPADLALLKEYEDYFRCPVLFGQAASELVLSAQSLTQPLLLADPDLQQTLEMHAQAQLARRHAEPSLAERVRAILRLELQKGNAASRDRVAEELGMSGRSLHRHLENSGSSYREIFDQLRFDLARELLRDPARSVDAVAQQLAFQESQSFIRWFRRLAGSTPGEFRQRLHSGAG